MFYDLLGPPSEMEDLYQKIQMEARRKIAFRRLLSTLLIENNLLNVSELFHITNLGCGDGNDCDDIDNCFHDLSQPYHQLAIDCDAQKIAYAQKYCVAKATTFIEGDASDHTITRHYPKKTDLVLLRHPEIFEGNEMMWCTMILHAVKTSPIPPSVLVTTYDEEEFELVKKHIIPNIPTSRTLFAGENVHRDFGLARSVPNRIQGGKRKRELTICPDQYLVIATP